MSKKTLLKQLFQKRVNDELHGFPNGFQQVGDFHGGVYDSFGHVSPWTKSACNVDSPIMVVAQDWSSTEALASPPKDINLGYDPDLPTNKNLQRLLKDFFGLSFNDIYATNLFVFVKPGRLSARIPNKLLEYSAENYTLSEIQIVSPKVVICLGSITYKTLEKVIKRNNLDLVTKDSSEYLQYEGARIVGVPHTGALGTMNAGGMKSVRQIWSQVSTLTQQNLH